VTATTIPTTDHTATTAETATEGQNTMDATTAMNQTDGIVTNLIDGLSADQREAPTPCTEWTVHDLLGHMCSGGHMIAGALQGAAPVESAPDYLADGPAAGWSAMSAELRSAATPEALTASHQLPFGEMPGEVALSVIVADHLTHAWDLAKASGQDIVVDDELADWALATWKQVVPAEGRTGDGFKAAVTVGADSSPLDQLVAYTGRTP
jgi:uncharacterized protein (TIGR03086 family)